MGAILQDIIDLFGILISPAEVARKLAGRPRILVPVCTLLILNALISAVNEPFFQRYKQEVFSLPDASPAEPEGSMRSPVVAPFSAVSSTLFRWSLFALCIFLAVATMAEKSAEFKVIFALVVYAEIIPVVMELGNALILQMNGVHSIDSIPALHPLPGVDFFFPGSGRNIPAFLVLNSINLFSIWYLAVLTRAVAVVTGLRTWTSGVIVAGPWFIGLLLLAGAAAVAMKLSGGFVP